MQITETVYDVAVDGRVAASFEFRSDAVAYSEGHVGGAQIRTRSETKTVPASFAVFVNNERISVHKDPGVAAKAAKKAGGMIKMVAATD